MWDRLRSFLIVISWIGAALAASGCSSHFVDAVTCEADCTPASGDGTGGTGNTIRPIHRYSFDAIDSNEVLDSIGNRTGVLVDAVYDGYGNVVMEGLSSDQYVDLPKHLLSGLTNCTFESWVTWLGGPMWQRVFDFGEDETGIEDSRSAQPRSYVFLALKPEPRVAFKRPPLGSNEIIVEAGFAMPTNTLTHVAVVVDEDNQRLALYVNGREEASNDFGASLRDVYDVSDWLGRSLYRGDPSFAGSLSEFRIYDRALSRDEVLASYAAGADALP